MSILVYQEQEFPFNADFDYIVKKNGEEIKHTISVKLTEKQLAKFDMADKTVADAMESSDPEAIAKNMLTPDQIKDLKQNTNNEYQYNMILSNMAGHIMGFISAQRVEGGISAMNSTPVMQKYGKYLK
ncbi:MAG: hypothetical protein WC476_08925 [Phycisphaerae bacterium]|jgi:hypothetical protein